MQHKWYRYLLCVITVWFGAYGNVGAQIEIGFVFDGPWNENVEIESHFEKEILELTQGEFEVTFSDRYRLVGDWTVSGVRTHLDELLADSNVDLVIAAGVLASQDVCRRGPLAKPVIAPFVLNRTLQNAPFKDGASGVKNLSYITFPADVAYDIQVFREVVPFTKSVFLSRSIVAEGIPGLRENLLASIASLDVSLEFITVDTDGVEKALGAIASDIEAVLVAPMLGLPDAQVQALIDGLIARKLPTYSLMGTSEVERGIMVGIAPDFNMLRLARRVALNVQRILLGEDPSTFRVVFDRGERLTINMATAKAIGIFPSWEVMTEAEILDESSAIEQVLTLRDAMKSARNVNLDLAAKEREVESGAQDVAEARAVWLPQIEASASGVWLDDDLGSPQQAEKTVSGALTVSQLLFSAQALANVTIQRQLYLSRELERDALRLDIVADAASGYLNVLRAKALEGIRKDNVRVSRSNLELARVRQSVGFSGPGEVYRWESQIANDRKAAIEANAQRNLAEMALNRVLHKPLESGFQTVEIGLNNPSFLTAEKRMDQYIGNKWAFGIFRSFMVEEGLRLAPELKQLDAAIEAQDRALRAARRAFFVPTIALQGEISNLFDRRGAGAASPAFGGDLTWNVGLRASLPLFSGGSRFALVRKAEAELYRLRLLKQATAERIEQRTRSALHQLGASFAAIRLSKQSADAAAKNLELITDAYSRGVVSVLDLLDAQNAAVTSELAAANAVYDFLLDMTESERSIGRFIALVDPAEEDDFFKRLETYFNQTR